MLRNILFFPFGRGTSYAHEDTRALKHSVSSVRASRNGGRSTKQPGIKDTQRNTKSQRSTPTHTHTNTHTSTISSLIREGKKSFASRHHVSRFVRKLTFSSCHPRCTFPLSNFSPWLSYPIARRDTSRTQRRPNEQRERGAIASIRNQKKKVMHLPVKISAVLLGFHFLYAVIRDVASSLSLLF